jgi:predicted RNA methylase
VRGKRVLEPSCGDGEIVRACLDAGAQCVSAVELDTDLARRAKQRFRGRIGFGIVCKDFLAWEGLECDVATANTPYENGADAAHLEHMLRFAPRAVVVMRLNALAGTERYERLWSRFDVRAVYVLPQRPDFGREARRVGLRSTGAESDFVVVDVLARAPRGGVSRPTMEWIRRPHS